MATTTVTGPDGKDYEVTHPDGASDAEIINFAKTNYGGHSEKRADTPIYGEGGYGEKVSRPGIFGFVKDVKERVNAEHPWMGPVLGSVVPETPGQAVAQGVMTATGMGAARPAVQAIGRIAPPLARVLGGTAAGAAGSAIDTGDPSTGALTGGAITAATETAIPMGSKVVRSLPWMKGHISELDSSRIGKTIEDIVPQLKGVRTTPDLQNMGRVYDSGKKNLVDLFKDIESQVGTVPISVPSINNQGTITVSEALKELGKIGSAGYTPNWSRIDPMVRTTVGMDARAMREQVLNEIRQEMQRLGSPVVGGQPGTPYLEQYDKAREMYLKGLGLLKMFKSSQPYREFPNAQQQLYTPALQKYLSENRGELLQRLGPKDFQKLVDSVQRGGELGTRDVLTPGHGGPLDAVLAWSRGQNTGATQMFRVPVTTMLPNIGSQYTGRAPYTAPEGIKVLMDLLGITATTGQGQ
jgi:hypothetical protein